MIAVISSTYHSASVCHLSTLGAGVFLKWQLSCQNTLIVAALQKGVCVHTHILYQSAGSGRLVKRCQDYGTTASTVSKCRLQQSLTLAARVIILLSGQTSNELKTRGSAVGVV